MLSLNYSDKCCSIQSAPQNSDVPKVDAVRELQILGSVNTPHSAICQENVANLRSQGNIVSVNDSSFCSASARSGRSSVRHQDDVKIGYPGDGVPLSISAPLRLTGGGDTSFESQEEINL